MTPSIDPNKKKVVNSQFRDTYDWSALISPKEKVGKTSPNPIIGCLSFLNRFISYESLYGDSEGAKHMSKVLLLLQSVDAPSSHSQLLKTCESYDYVCLYLEMLKETEAPFDVCFEFERLGHVLGALIRIRKQSQLGVQCSYGHLRQQLMQDPSFGSYAA